MKRILSLCVFLLPAFTYAEEIRIVAKEGNGYRLEIDRVAYRAIPENNFNKLESRIAEDAIFIDKLATQLSLLKEELEKSQANAARYQEVLTAQTNLNNKYQQLNNNYSTLNKKYSDTATELVGLNKSYGTTLDEFDKLVEKYRKVAVRTHPRSKWDFGLGILNSTGATPSSQAFLMAGSGVKLINTEFRGWLMLGTESYGAMVGVSF